MKKTAIWILILALVLTAAACGSKTPEAAQTPAAEQVGEGQTTDPQETDAAKPAEAQTASEETFSITAYEVGGVKYEGEQLEAMKLTPTQLILRDDHSGKLILQGEEMDINWTDDGRITVAGMDLYTMERVGADTVVINIYETKFTMQKEGAVPAEQPAAAEATEAPAEETQQGVEPYGDSDGVLDRDKVIALYHWMDSMPREFKYALTFDEIGEAVGKAGHDEQNGDGSTHAASWTDGDKTIVLVTFREKEGVWTCGGISFSGFSREEYEAADISAFPPSGSSVPAGTVPVEEHTFEFSLNDSTVTLTAKIPQRYWYPAKRSDNVRFYCAPNEARADYSDAYIIVALKKSEEDINLYQDSFAELVELEGRKIGGIDMIGRSYQYVGMDWIEFYGEVQEGVWVSIQLTGVDFSAGTETTALVDSLTFTVR